MNIRITTSSLFLSIIAIVLVTTPVLAETIPSVTPIKHDFRQTSTDKANYKSTTAFQDSKRSASNAATKSLSKTSDKLLAADKQLQSLVSKFDTLTPKLQLLVSSQSANQKAQLAFTDYKAKLADAKQKIVSVTTILNLLTTTGITDAKSSLTKAKMQLVQAKEDMQKMTIDIKLIRGNNEVKKIDKITVSKKPEIHGK